MPKTPRPHSACPTPARAGLALAAILALAPAALAQHAALPTTPALDQTIRDRLGVTAYSLQTLITPMDPSQGFAVTLNLAGRVCTADFAPDPVNSADCVMELHDGSAHPTVLPAPPSCTYSGVVRGFPESVCSGSLVNGELTAVLLLGPDGGAWSIQPLTDIDPAANPATHIVSGNGDIAPGPWRCGVEQDPRGVPLAAPAGARRGSTDNLLWCELACEADYPYFQSVGTTASGVAQDIAGLMANVRAYYIASGIPAMRFRIVRYIIRVTPQGNPFTYNTSDPGALLSSFRNLWNVACGDVTRDTAHLFTGRDLDGQVVGLAYLNSVCVTQWGYGLSQSRFTLQPGRRAALTAHEIAHNFGAQHCDAPNSACSPCWLMSARQGTTANELTRFGCSTSIISNFLQTRTCLAPPPIQTPPPSCPADFDNDGALTGADFGAFRAAFAAGEPRADLDGDALLTIRDYAGFMSAYAAGCP